MNIIFFGSTTDSVIVLLKLHQFVIDHPQFTLAAVVTQPPKPVGRKQEITQTPVELWAKKNGIPVMNFVNNEHKPWLYQNEADAVNTLSSFKPDLLISACYGQKIPLETIKQSTYGGINIHPSLLPRWRGADPIPWTILTGDAQTGVTLVTIDEKFDQGNIIAQKKISITDKDFPDELRTRLFTMGADLLVTVLPDYGAKKQTLPIQKPEDATYARKLTRADGFIPWELIQEALLGHDIPRKERAGLVNIVSEILSESIVRVIRALTPWPGVWSTLPNGKRVKILAAHVDNATLCIETVQLEGKNPVDWKQFEKAYIAE